MSDVNEIKRFEKALQKSEKEKNLILDSVSEHIVFQDTENRII